MRRAKPAWLILPFWVMTTLPFDSSNLAADASLSLGVRPEHLSLKAAPGTGWRRRDRGRIPRQ